MTKDEIIDKDEVLNMAIQAGAIPVHKDPKNKALVGNENIEAFAKLVADVVTAKEREACASLCDELVIEFVGNSALTADQCARTIRARGEA